MILFPATCVGLVGAHAHAAHSPPAAYLRVSHFGSSVHAARQGRPLRSFSLFKLSFWAAHGECWLVTCHENSFDAKQRENVITSKQDKITASIMFIYLSKKVSEHKNHHVIKITTLLNWKGAGGKRNLCSHFVT